MDGRLTAAHLDTAAVGAPFRARSPMIHVYPVAPGRAPTAAVQKCAPITPIFTIPLLVRACLRRANGVAIRHGAWPRARSRGGRRHWRPPGSFGQNVRDGRNYTLRHPGRKRQIHHGRQKMRLIVKIGALRFGFNWVDKQQKYCQFCRQLLCSRLRRSGGPGSTRRSVQINLFGQLKGRNP